MKLEVQKISEKTEGVLQEQLFGIGNTALVMDLLRTKLYSDPLLSCFREIACNALDANIENNEGVTPIEVTLPTAFSPTLVISDSGIGLSPERIQDIYTKYGNSTKRESNDYIGAMGIGSKSPFGICDQFNVTTINNGILYNYSVYIDPSRLGKISLLDKFETKLSSGTSISIPIQPHDVDRLYERAHHITCFWEVKPKFKGRTVSYNNETKLFSGDNWYCSNSASISSFMKTTSAVILSNIPYDLDVEKVGLPAKDQELLRACKFRLFFKTGELSISGSRDGLHYDSKTNNAIKARVAEIRKQINQSISSSITGAKTYLEAVTKVEGIKAQYRDVFLNNLVPSWNGIPIHSQVSNRELPNLVAHFWKKPYYRKKWTIERNSNFRVALTGPIKVILNDLNSDKVPSYLTQHFFQNTQVMVLSLDRESKKDLTWDTYPEFKLLEQLATDKLSNYKLSVQAREQSDRIQAGVGNILVYDLRLGRNVAREIPNDDFVSVVWDYKNGQFIDPVGNWIQPSTLDWKLLDKDRLPLLEKFIGKPVYGITQARRNSKAKKTINYTDLLKEKLGEAEAKYPQALRKEVQEELNALSRLNYRFLDHIDEIKNPILEKFKATIKYYRELSAEMQVYNEILYLSGNRERETYTTEGNKCKDALKEFFVIYPLLEKLTGWSPTTIKDYVALVDKAI